MNLTPDMQRWIDSHEAQFDVHSDGRVYIEWRSERPDRLWLQAHGDNFEDAWLEAKKVEAGRQRDPAAKVPVGGATDARTLKAFQAETRALLIARGTPKAKARRLVSAHRADVKRAWTNSQPPCAATDKILSEEAAGQHGQPRKRRTKRDLASAALGAAAGFAVGRVSGHMAGHAVASEGKRTRDCSGWDPDSPHGWEQCKPSTIPKRARKWLRRTRRDLRSSSRPPMVPAGAQHEGLAREVTVRTQFREPFHVTVRDPTKSRRQARRGSPAAEGGVPAFRKSKRDPMKKSAKFERCVRAVKKRGGAKNPWAVCHATLGDSSRRDPPEISSSIRMGIATLSHNRAFSARDLAEYRGLSLSQANAIIRKLAKNHMLRKMEDGWYPTSAGWDWIEGRPPGNYDSKGMRTGGRRDFGSFALGAAAGAGAMYAGQRLSERPKARAYARLGRIKARKAAKSTARHAGAHLTAWGERDPMGPKSHRRPKTSGGFSETMYHANEIATFRKELARLEREKPSREEVSEWAEALGHEPELVAERIDWILAGHYGQGAYLEAHKAIRGRGNAPAWLTQAVGALEWSIPFRITRAEWNKLTNTQKSRLAHQVDQVIARNLKGE